MKLFWRGLATPWHFHFSGQGCFPVILYEILRFFGMLHFLNNREILKIL